MLTADIPFAQAGMPIDDAILDGASACPFAFHLSLVSVVVSILSSLH